ncbi:MAG TPA: SagB/ThcOx family dehydrogenase [Pseudonocardiaceae bacterium]
MRLRRARSLVCYWLGDGFVVENYATNRSYRMDVTAVALLDELTDWVGRDDIGNLLAGHDPASVAQAVEQLHGCGLIVSDTAAETGTDARIGEAWPQWGPAARYLHFATRNTPYVPDSVEVRTGIVGDGEPPALSKSCPGAPRIPLPRRPPPTAASFFDVLYARRTHRAFTEEPVALVTFATLLATVFGPVAYLDADAFGTVMQRTSACGGSRHEIEAYVVARWVSGVPAGVYHYQHVEHALEWLGPHDDWADLAAMSVDQSGIGEAPFVVVLTAVLERIQFKYRDTGAYRVMLLNAGHLGQTFALVATALGLGPFQTAAFADERLERLIGVDGVTETVLYLLSAGHPVRTAVPGDRRFIPPAALNQVRLT